MGAPYPARQPLRPAALCLPLSHHPGLYLPRKATDSPLYRIVQDNLEDLLVRGLSALTKMDPVLLTKTDPGPAAGFSMGSTAVVSPA